MSLNDYKEVFEALDNQKRRDIIQFIFKEKFVSKNDLTIKFDLKRASLNHHLKIITKAKLLIELNLKIDGKSQTFLYPSVNINTRDLIKQNEEYNKLNELFSPWQSKNLTLETWSILQSSLFSSSIPSDFIHIIENKLSPVIGRRSSSDKELCFVCKDSLAKSTCFTCKNFICNTHAHQIDREDMGEIILCPNCIKKFFG